MRDLPDERAGTSAQGDKEHAWTSVNEARASWSGAMRAHEQAPPESRLSRSTTNTCRRGCRDARRSRPSPSEEGSAGAHRRLRTRAPPYELRPGTGRRGPTKLWARFDAAVQTQLGGCGRQPGRRRRRVRRSSPRRRGAGRRIATRGEVTQHRSARARIQQHRSAPLHRCQHSARPRPRLADAATARVAVSATRRG